MKTGVGTRVPTTGSAQTIASSAMIKASEKLNEVPSSILEPVSREGAAEPKDEAAKLRNRATEGASKDGATKQRKQIFKCHKGRILRFDQGCGSGMIYSGSGSGFEFIYFLFRIRIRIRLGS